MSRERRRWHAGARALGLLAAGAAAALRADEAALVAAGREVYIAEGCIHCHSQYVRPDTGDALRWGPVRPLAEILAATPPLPGNRRQGPDLLNVGNRRTPEWNRLHLRAPRAVTPGSRMPSYAHLFAGDGARGEALVAYLASLGADTLAGRLATVAAWQPAPVAPLLDADATRRRFAQLCAPCHGAEGRGDGPLAAALARAPRDLVRGRWLFLGPPADPAAERIALARAIKFGLPGTAMAGHEYLGDVELLSLATLVQALHAPPTTPSPP